MNVNRIAVFYPNNKTGRPKDIAMLYSIDELRSDFAGYEIITLEEKEIELNEGLFHNGTGSVIRFVGRKSRDHSDDNPLGFSLCIVLWFIPDRR